MERRNHGQRSRYLGRVSAWVLIFLLFSDLASGYPSNTRFGYTSCRTCHVSPTGGGALSLYGKSTGDETTTWSNEGESHFLHGLFKNQPDWFSIGGDTRLIYVRNQTKDYLASRAFPMQADAELALHLSDQITFDADAGFYGEQRQFQSRRHYILLIPKPNITLRFGRFFPAYGIMIPDHTAIARRILGWDQNYESYNLETSFTWKYGELFLTGILGRGGEEQLTSEKGVSGRASIYLGKSSQIGVSGLLVRGETLRYSFGPFSLIGWTEKIYSLTQLDFQFLDTGDIFQGYRKSTIGFNELGIELFKGFDFITQYEYYSDKETSNGIGVGFQWFPRPHFEILGTYTRRTVDFISTDTSILMLHYHL